MPWPVIPFSQLGGVSGRFFPIYQRWPPETIQVLVVGGGGSGQGDSAGGGGGGGVRDFSFSTGLLPGGNASYPIVVGGAGGTSSFLNSSYQATGGLNSILPNNLVGGASGTPAGNGSSYAGGFGASAFATNPRRDLGMGGGGGAYSGPGGNWQQIGNDYYHGRGALGYTVSSGVSNALGGMYVLASGGGGGNYVGGTFQNWCTWFGRQIRSGGTQPGAGTGRYCVTNPTSASWYGCGGGGGGGSGMPGVVVVSYAGTQASPSGTVSSFGGFTYHVFTAANATLEL
jgi:hypothetical protein